HGITDRFGGRIEIDDRTAAQPAGQLVADADDARPVVFDAADKTADLAGADIDRGYQAAARPRGGGARAGRRAVCCCAVCAEAVRPGAVPPFAPHGGYCDPLTGFSPRLFSEARPPSVADC